MKTAPKGRMPPMSIVKSRLRYHAWLGLGGVRGGMRCGVRCGVR